MLRILSIFLILYIRISLYSFSIIKETSNEPFKILNHFDTYNFEDNYSHNVYLYSDPFSGDENEECIVDFVMSQDETYGNMVLDEFMELFALQIEGHLEFMFPDKHVKKENNFDEFAFLGEALYEDEENYHYDPELRIRICAKDSYYLPSNDILASTYIETDANGTIKGCIISINMDEYWDF